MYENKMLNFFELGLSLPNDNQQKWRRGKVDYCCIGQKRPQICRQQFRNLHKLSLIFFGLPTGLVILGLTVSDVCGIYWGPVFPLHEVLLLKDVGEQKQGRLKV